MGDTGATTAQDLAAMPAFDLPPAAWGGAPPPVSLLELGPGPRPALHRDARATGLRPPVLYVHGATFPAALSIFWRFADRSWADALEAAGFDVWALDFTGYGAAERYPAQARPPAGSLPLLRAAEAASQVAAALRAIATCHGGRPAGVIAHSWGGMPAAMAASPERVGALVLFAPILARQDGVPPAPPRGAWRAVTLEEQRERFAADLPPGHAPLLLDPTLAAWGPAWLAAGEPVAQREPAAVAVPNGPLADIADAWSGRLPYDPVTMRVPMLLARGAWDRLCTDADAAWLTARWGHPVRRDLRIPGGTHQMHLEHGREALIAASIGFLGGLLR